MYSKCMPNLFVETVCLKAHSSDSCASHLMNFVALMGLGQVKLYASAMLNSASLCSWNHTHDGILRGDILSR